MKSFVKSIGLIALLLGTAALTRADNVLVDTGPGNPNAPEWALGGVGNNYPQSLAAQFTLTQDVTITSLEGWISSFNPEYLRIAVTDNSNGTIPGAQIWADNVQLSGDSIAAWQGFTNLNLFLSAGTYWVAFIANESLSAGMQSGVPNPLGIEAFVAVDNGNWHEYDDLNFGVRIKGDSVPDSASVLGLVGLALGAMVMIRRRIS
ncbi:MAG: hypothetical protein JSR48_08555 [Verrucomicrobia bacterium]|nr:hypothetical protein [Verrucomicrobiota bacterium]